MNADTMPCIYVVGVAEDIKAQKLDGEDDYYYYLPAAQFHPEQGGLFVRTRRRTERRSARPIRRALQKEMPGASYMTVTPFGDIVGNQTQVVAARREHVSHFGMLALVLAAIGLFSVISYNVAQRTHELGVRVALGAQMGDLIRLVVSEGMKLGVIGVAIGAAIALGAGRWITPLLFGESPRDPSDFWCGHGRAALGDDDRELHSCAARGAGRSEPGAAIGLSGH